MFKMSYSGEEHRDAEFVCLPDLLWSRLRTSEYE